MGPFPFERALKNQAVLAAQDSEIKALKAGPKDGVGLQSTKLKNPFFISYNKAWILLFFWSPHFFLHMFFVVPKGTGEPHFSKT